MFCYTNCSLAHFGKTVVLVLSLFGSALLASEGNISKNEHNAWSENAGWIDFRPEHGGATVHSDHLSGFIWAENMGWIQLGSDAGGPYVNTSSTNWGVNRDVNGNFSGYAWSETSGWIDFNPTHSQVTIDPDTGQFDGYAWGENCGWVHFRSSSADYGVAMGIVTLQGLIVNQAIQDMSNSGPLISGKKTMVRAIMECCVPGPLVLKNFKLRGIRGTELAGSPLSAISPGHITVVAGASDKYTVERSQFLKTINFVIPHSWTDGEVTLELVEGNHSWTPNEPVEPGGIKGDGKITVQFTQVDIPQIKLIAIDWTETRAPGKLEIEHLMISLKAAFPIDAVVNPELGYMKYTSPLPDISLTGDTLGLLDVNLALQTKRNLDLLEGKIGPDTYYYGILVDPSTPDRASGLAFEKVSSGFFYIGKPDDINPHCHQIAHMFDLDHPKRSADLGFCGEKCPPEIELFPNVLLDYPVISPLIDESSAEEIVFGFNSSKVKNHYVSSIVLPDSRDFMSYCSNFWVSDYHYQQLISNIMSMPEVVNSDKCERSVQDYVHFQGQINLDEGTVEWVPFINTSSDVTPETMETGSFSLRLFDITASLLTSIPFSPIVPYALESDSNIGVFSIIIPENLSATDASIFENETELSSFTRSLNAPTIEVTYPNGGETITDELFSVTWTANDVDLDSLFFTVQHSGDNGLTWDTLVSNIQLLSFLVDKSMIPAGDSNLMRISVSDGFNALSDESDAAFFLTNNPPELIVVLPVNGSLFAGTELIQLNARAFDREDGYLENVNISFTSDLDGLIGQNQESVIANHLSPGQHQIAVSAIDSHGDTTYEVLDLKIIEARCTEAVLPLIDLGPMWPGQTIVDFVELVNLYCP